ncbi:MAG: hypothetical protein AB1390_12330, partial [Nitrospirota bacterium]
IRPPIHKIRNLTAVPVRKVGNYSGPNWGILLVLSGDFRWTSTGVAKASGENYLKLTSKRAFFDFERSSNSSLSQMKGILLGVEVHPEAHLYDEYQNVAESVLSVCREDTEMLSHLEVNFRLKNAVVITLIGIPLCPPTYFKRESI